MTGPGRSTLASAICARIRELNLPNLAAFAAHAGLPPDTLRVLLTSPAQTRLSRPTLDALALALARPACDLQYLLDPASSPACPYAAPLYDLSAAARTPLPGAFVPLDRAYVAGRDLVAFTLRGALLIVDRARVPVTGQLLTLTVRGHPGYLIGQLRPAGQFGPPPGDLTGGPHAPLCPTSVSAITGTVVDAPFPPGGWREARPDRSRAPLTGPPEPAA